MIYNIITWAMTVVFYFVSAICLYKIGRRRGIKNSGVAWVPFFGEYWMLGKIADHYDQWRSGKDDHLKIWLLVSAVAAAISEVVILYYSYWLTMMVMGDPSLDMIGGMLWWILALIIVMMVLIGVCVVYGFALYRTFYSCRPKHAVLLTVMSMVFAFFCIGPIVCFLCAYRKDDGFVETEIIDPEAEKKRLELYN